MNFVGLRIVAYDRVFVTSWMRSVDEKMSSPLRRGLSVKKVVIMPLVVVGVFCKVYIYVEVGKFQYQTDPFG